MEQLVWLHASLRFGDNANRKMTIESALRRAEDLWSTIESTGTSTPYRPSDDEFTQSTYRLLELTQNGITPDRYERMTLESYIWKKRAIVEIRIGLTTADMHIPEMHRCSETDDNQSPDYSNIYDLIWNLPYLIYFLSMTMIVNVTSNWILRYRYMYRRPCRTEYNTGLLLKRQNHAPYGRDFNADYNTEYNAEWLQIYITENTIPNEILTQTRPSQATELRWQLMTINQFLNQALMIALPYEAVWD
jgi:hypothetical protein